MTSITATEALSAVKLAPALEVRRAAETPSTVEDRPVMGERLDAALRKAVAELAEPVRQIVSYHFGWTTPDGLACAGGTGKMLRPALVFAATRAVAGSPDPGLPAAVASSWRTTAPCSGTT